MARKRTEGSIQRHRQRILNAAIEAMQGDNLENAGFCLACGEEAYGVEPDARKYPCEACGAKQVFGAEELIVMLG